MSSRADLKDWIKSVFRMALQATLLTACLGPALHAQGLAPSEYGPMPTPSWAAQVPQAFRAGGVGGSSCWAMPWARGLSLMPRHCAPASSDLSSQARDYWLGATAHPGAPVGLGQVHRPERSRSAGEQVWIFRGGAWSPARIVSAAGGSYWLRSMGSPFCPGDSGAPLWAGEDGSPKWIGMLVSGERGGCSMMGSALKAQSLPWER